MVILWNKTIEDAKKGQSYVILGRTPRDFASLFYASKCLKGDCKSLALCWRIYIPREQWGAKRKKMATTHRMSAVWNR